MENVGLIRMTLEEFIERYHEQPFELLEGVIVPLSPTVAGHSVVIKRLIRIFIAYEAEHGGEAFSETTFALTHDRNWVKGSRQPDVMYYSDDRLQAYRESTPDWAAIPFVLVPDVAIEVVSKNDKYTEINHKVDLYLADGVKQVWVIDPQQKTVNLHEPGTTQHTRLTTNDTLDGGSVLPGLSIELSSLFAGLSE